ncbi:SsrA-binding protein SmpB [Rhodospirillum rubrum]|uniref:SsrA-binding protein n=1 Tax=Rhodospirillum rubrum (strain ATCC 11170 / ATH 1.1.1 / DSM 467 / LMG 4362 / NCIMB 8255 / S1) TaxID=269796 RepID=SSRP_RHORT|nr:SsrA-binding protein SmpB [Rhodospirillum rubrum]Q2RT81.1 RecName: Full=SsrA-binding protein; AltName: Full=Small protein B [Rhodospirillum rubrum ATCC 11170]ABC22664.1 SsrA-binding protein [Rhodospirillum rubrum ATCC 11170]AEO48382.1 SsrA-binding protein [Rhodospirillum rubrum F11]MBK1664181.1 SsrA-binding protein [Rhodospirillum rubrum]MBK1675798.1 SsrA-binding protein [Rhodospirillum rubrum]MBK5954261.1 SsrA-binding protein [Rhodospirillum rubrum]
MARAGNSLISHGRVAENRRARHDYSIEETIEAGLILVGTEVKSLRTGRANIADSYAGPKSGELYLYNAYIPDWTQAVKAFAHEPRQPRKLLVHRREARRLISAINKDGMTLVPLYLYFNDRGFAKVQLGLAKGRKAHDKRQAIKEREWNRDKARVLRDKG